MGKEGKYTDLEGINKVTRLGYGQGRKAVLKLNEPRE